MGHIVDSIISNNPPKVPDSGQTSPASAAQKLEAGDHSRASGNTLRYKQTRPGGFAVRQEISLGADSTAAGNVQEVNILSETEYYFELQPFERGDYEDGASEYVKLLPNTPLRAGRTYRVRVTLSPNRYRSSPDSISPTYRLNQQPYKVTEKVFIYLSISKHQQNISDAVQVISPPEGCLSFSDSTTPSHDFEFIILKSYPQTITIELNFQESKNSLLKFAAALELKLELEGSDNAPPFNEMLNLLASALPPASTAILHVCFADEKHLRLIGWAGNRADSSLNLNLEAFKWADIKDCPDEESYMQEITNAFHDYTVGQVEGDVSSWFEKALHLYGEKCGIVIVDETGSQIPWEMFKLTDGRYLGAHTLIVRWAEPQYRKKNAAILSEGTRFNGRVCAYVHPTDAGKIAEDPTMRRLLPTPNETPLTFQHDLIPSEGASPVGLVYLCYGGILYYGDEQQTLVGMLRFKPHEQDVQIRFNLVSGNLNPRPVVFANAPYSGRILMSGQQSCGLANAILTQVAVSYIGMLAPIERSYAARFARKLLEAAASEEGVKPAELLRRLRAEAVTNVRNKNLSKKEWEQAYYEFAYPFMYVHYGHPHDWLKINCALDQSKMQREGEDG